LVVYLHGARSALYAMPKYTRSSRVWLLPLAFLLFGCWPYCQLGGGMTDTSVTVDGDDGTRVEAEAQGGETRARLEFERETIQKSKGFEVTYVFDKTHITQTLTLVINEGGDDTSFLVSKHNEASSFKSHALEVSPDGKVVAYKLGNKMWRFVHVLTPTFAAHGDTKQEKLDWASVPSADGPGFVSIFKAQDLRLDGTHSFERQEPMLDWLLATQGQEALADALFGLIPAELHDWHDRAKLLDKKGRARLAERMLEKLDERKPHPTYFAIAHEQGLVDLAEADPGLVRRGTRALANHDNTMGNSGTDLAEYLRVHAANDLAAAAKVACKVIGHKAKLAPNGRPYAIDLGRPLALVSFTILARSGATCDALKDWDADPCTACDGSCTNEAIDAHVERVLSTPVPMPGIGETPSEPEVVLGLIVGAAGRTCE
jgi:hypothetical protein